MIPNKSCLPIFSFSILILLIISFSSKIASGKPLVKWCINSPYDPLVDTGYAANLNSLLSSLTLNASAANNTNNYGFYNSTAGVVDSLDVVYGLYLCRGDVNKSDCETCVQTASRDILTECPNNKTAIVWYDNCLLRYSNQTDFPDSGPLYMWDKPNSTDPEKFSDYVGNTMNELAESVSSDVSLKKFGVREGNFSAFEKFFGLAQCIPDLTSFDCNSCLAAAVNVLPKCCEGRLGIKVFASNCNIRYETFRFYNVVPPPPGRAPSPRREGKKQMSVRIIISIAVAVAVAVAVIIVVVAFVCMRKRTKTSQSSISDTPPPFDAILFTLLMTEHIKFTWFVAEEIPTPESRNYSLSEVQSATNNFSEDCKIGSGGFGQVYKGTLTNGEEVAIKRLSQSSVQGLEEFKNEIMLLARLQHRNLVRLLGFCFENQEMILIYEFFRNKSLDHFLFDLEKRRQFDWTTRYKIIGGIARGLLYLHEDSRIRIIHRDLKPSNVLMDDNMNAKIADFGIARLIQVDQSEENTNRIAGTYGYMAPEYALYGHISMKSDVFSFGVLLLEIISGKKNNTFYQTNGDDDLLSHAWNNFRNGTPLALLDPFVGDIYERNEVIQCVHIGLLCIQDDVELRPKMASVVLMLNGNIVTLPTPLQPLFTTTRTTTGSTTQ